MIPDYMQKYTDVRTGQLSFSEFMEFVNEIYCMGHTNGSLTAQSELLKRIDAQMNSSSAGSDTTRVAYETLF
jgi:hypothetical protein